MPCSLDNKSSSPKSEHLYECAYVCVMLMWEIVWQLHVGYSLTPTCGLQRSMSITPSPLNIPEITTRYIPLIVVTIHYTLHCFVLSFNKSYPKKKYIVQQGSRKKENEQMSPILDTLILHNCLLYCIPNEGQWCTGVWFCNSSPLYKYLYQTI